MISNMQATYLRVFVLFISSAVVLMPTILQMESVWRHSEKYMHCYFVIPIALYMIWVKRESLKGFTPQISYLPVILLIPICLIWLSAYAIDVGFVSHISQILIFQLLLWHIFGNQIILKLMYPVSFLIFLAPFGDSLTPALQEITADIGVLLLKLVDVPVYRDGLYIHTSVTAFEVADACSGLNFFISSAVISLLFSYLYFSNIIKRIIFVTFVLILSILSNGLRAFLLMLIGEKTNMAWGFGDDHYYYGWAVFGITILFCFWIGEHFADDFHSTTQISRQNFKKYLDKKPLYTNLASISVLIIFLILYIWRSSLPYSVQPKEKDQIFNAAEFIKQDNSPLGTTFLDGIRRSQLIVDNNIELFGADYSIRQDKGDLITWHNRLFDPKKWTITQKKINGSYNNSYEFIQLTSIDGRKYTLLYWYQIGSVRTSNEVFIKLQQLRAILLHESVDLGVRMIAVSGYDFESGQQLLVKIASERLKLIEIPN